MMKLSISTLACDGWTLEYSVEVCRECGADALEVRMGIHEWSKMDSSDKKLKSNYQIIENAGLKVSDLATGVVVTRYDENALHEIERCAQIAGLWKCRGLRVMLGHFKKRWSEPYPESDYEGILRWLRAADQIMERYGTEIWIETHNDFSTGQRLKKVLEESGGRNCRLLWDIMHPLEAGETVEDTMNYMKGLLAHVHIKDGRPKEDTDLVDYQYTKIGEGAIPVGKVVQLLRQDGYDGYYSLEWEGKWREELRGAGFEPENAIRGYVEVMRRFI